MPACCRCNSSGRRKKCVCVQAGRPCTICLSSRRGNCTDGHSPAIPASTNPETPSTPAAATSSPVLGPEQDDSIDGPLTDSVCDLPRFVDISPPNFRWGRLDGITFSNLIHKAYNEIVHWRKTCFKFQEAKQVRQWFAMKKRHKYERRVIDVEHRSFTPLVFSMSGGWGPSATVTFRRLISNKVSQPYSATIGFIQCKIALSLIDSAVMCLHGARSSLHNPSRDLNLHDHPLDLIATEAQWQV